MKTDRELLELAAKAAGHTAQKDKYGYLCILLAENEKLGQLWCSWNPLNDDGDALRLAIKLRMRMEIDDYSAIVNESEACFDIGMTDDQRNNATRRAIVCAAATIGRSMP